MKLKNRKTGEIGELHYEPDKEYHFTVATEDPADMAIYRSLAELNSDWEDYKPSGPLIKDEKIRKAVKAWWEAVSDAITDKRILYKNNQDFAIGVYTIYCGAIYPETLEAGNMYTIAELCGEEEE